MTGPLIRDARGGDGTALAALHLDVAEYYLQLQPDDFRMPDAEGLADHFEPSSQPADPDRLWIVAEIEGQLAGSLIAYLRHPAPGARFDLQPWALATNLHIDYLAVLRAHQRHGVASRLVLTAEDWGRSHDAMMSTLDTYSRSPVSVPFWTEREGYRRRSLIVNKPLR
jgi:GNAT superfamily N-acetyltransferase